MLKIEQKNNCKLSVILSVMVIAFAPAYVFADSSWIWLTDYRPFDILPVVAAATIIVEVFAIWLIPKTGKFVKTAIVAVVANAVSFLLPYAMLKWGMSWYGSLDDILNAGPNYIVGGAFLVLTICVEAPIVYNVLKKQVNNKKTLLWTIIAANAVTTAGVAIVERMITDGYWA